MPFERPDFGTDPKISGGGRQQNPEQGDHNQALIHQTKLLCIHYLQQLHYQQHVSDN